MVTQWQVTDNSHVILDQAGCFVLGCSFLFLTLSRVTDSLAIRYWLRTQVVNGYAEKLSLDHMDSSRHRLRFVHVRSLLCSLLLDVK
jgi:hypothetical protein